MNKFLILLSALVLNISVFASDSDSTKTTRANYNYVGLQSNLLFRQFLNLTNTSAINNNPFTLNYSSNNKKTGKGFCMGMGFDLASDITNDGVTQITDRLINFSGRVGFERKYNQQKKWVFYYSSELGAIITNTQTRTFNNSIGGTTTTIETTKIMAGYISRGGIMYKLGEYVTIGTETSLNLLIGLNNSRVNSNNFNTETRLAMPFDVGVKVPTAIYITLRY